MAEAAHRLTIQDTEKSSSDDLKNEGGSQNFNSENEGSDSSPPHLPQTKPERDHQVICPIDIQKATSSNSDSNSSQDLNGLKKINLMKKDDDEDDDDMFDSLQIPLQACKQLPQLKKYTSSPPVHSKGMMTTNNPKNDNSILINIKAAIGAGTGSPFTNNSQRRQRRQTMMPRMNRFGMMDQLSEQGSDDLIRQKSHQLPMGFSPLKMSKYNFMNTLNNSKRLKSNSLFLKQQSYLSRADSIKTIDTGDYAKKVKFHHGQKESNFKFTLNAYEDELEKMVIKNGLKTKKAKKSDKESHLTHNVLENNKIKRNIGSGRYIHQNKSKVINQIVDGHENLILKEHNSKRKELLEQQILNMKMKNIQRKSGYHEIPKILIEQSKKHLRNKNVLHKFMKPIANKGLKRIINRNLSKKTFREDEKFVSQKREPSMKAEKMLTRSFKEGSPEFQKWKTFKEDQSDELNVSQRSDKSSVTQEKQGVKADDEQFSDMDEQDEFIEQNKKSSVGSSFLVMFPDSTIRAIWDITVFVSIVYQGIMMPMRISFEMDTPEWLFFLEVCIDVMFLLDIVLNFNTGFYFKGQLIMSRKQIAIDYISTWLFIDLVSSLPYTWFLAWAQGVSIQSVESDDQESQLGALANTPQLLRLLKIAKLLKMLKILRVVKLKRILQKFDDMIVTDQMNLLVTFFNLTVKIIVVAHYMGCFFFYIGMDEVRQNRNGWLYAQQLLDEPFVDQYVTSIYWAFTTMAAVGYGEITPITQREKKYAIFTMIVTSGIFAYTVNRIGTIISSFNQTSSIYKEKMMYVNRFMIQQEVPATLRMKVRRYLDYIFQNKKEIKLEEQEVYPLLNENLNDKIQIYLKSQILGQIYFIQDFGMDFLIELTTFFHKVTFVADDFIFVEKDRAENIYYVIQGKIAMIHKQSHTFITDVEKDQHFGEIGFFSGQSRQLSAKSRDFTEVYRIKKEDLFGICENYIEAISAIRHIKESLDNNNYKPLKMRCYICREMDHVALKCPKFNKFRGNLMRMYAKQMNDKMKTKKRASSVAIKGSDKLTSDSETIEGSQESQVRQTFFVYQDEVQEAKLDVSMESEEDKNLKEQLIKQHTGIDDIELDGKLIEKILETPRKAKYEIQQALVKKSFLSLEKHVSNALAKSTYSSNMTPITKQSRNSRDTRDNIKHTKTNQFSDAVIQRPLSQSQYSGPDLNINQQYKKNSEHKISLGPASINMHPQSEQLNEEQLQNNRASLKVKNSDPTPSEKETPLSNYPKSTFANLQPEQPQNNFLHIEQNVSQDAVSASDKNQQFRSNISKQSKLTKINEDDKEFLSQEERESNLKTKEQDPYRDQFETQDLRKRKVPKKSQKQEEPIFMLKDQQNNSIQQRQVSYKNIIYTENQIQNINLKHTNSQQRNDNKLQDLLDNPGQLNIINSKQKTSVDNSESMDIKFIPSGLHSSLQPTSQNEPVSHSPIDRFSNNADFTQKANQQKMVQFMQDQSKDEGKKSQKRVGKHHPQYKHINIKREDHGSSNSQKRANSQFSHSSNYGSPTILVNQNSQKSQAYKFRDQIQICQERLETIKSESGQAQKPQNTQKMRKKHSEKNIFRDTDQNFKSITSQEKDKIRRAEIAKAYLTKEQQSNFKYRELPKLRKGNSNPNNKIENAECSGNLSYHSRFQQSNIDENGRQSLTQPRRPKNSKMNMMRSQKSPEEQKEKSGNGSRVTTSMSQLGNEQAMKIFTSSANNEDQKQQSPKLITNQQFTMETHNSMSDAQVEGEQIPQFHPREGDNSHPSAVPEVQNEPEEQKCDMSTNSNVNSQHQINQDQWLKRDKSAGKSQYIEVYPDVKSSIKSQK